MYYSNMHYWPNPSITKAQNKLGKFKGNRPKGLKDEEWKAMVAEYLYNKQLVLNCVPKFSQKDLVKQDK